ncbi:hypothetical protein [Serratia fonticola]|uniref:hypothetical protein n=1 Tax=Serratia fonticola TaxID=47917 RepID=UPI003AACA7F2
MSGNGGDNAHNNQFGGGGRGPTGGVNTGSGSSNGNAGDRGYGYWKLEPGIPSPKKNDPAGEVRIEITGGMKWVSDNSIHWSDGKGGSGNDNVRTNVTAKVDHGYRAAVDGYIYTVTVNGNNAITGVYLYSRPTTPSRQSWAQTETARMTQARALVQAQLDTKKAADAAAAKKAAETAAAAAAAAEAKRKAEEEAKRQQAAWDAAHPVEAAQRDVAAATSALNVANATINADNTQIAANNAAIQSKQQTVNQLQAELAPRLKQYGYFISIRDQISANNYFQANIAAKDNQQKSLNAEIANLNAQNTALNQDLQTQINKRNASSAALSAAQTRLNAANAEAERKRQAEAKRQAEEAARVKAAQEAAAKAKAAAEGESQGRGGSGNEGGSERSGYVEARTTQCVWDVRFPCCCGSFCSPYYFC